MVVLRMIVGGEECSRKKDNGMYQEEDGKQCVIVVAGGETRGLIHR